METQTGSTDISHSELQDYNPIWKELYEQEAQKIQEALGNRILKIEHIGSTSIPGLPSKPIIDIAVVVPTSKDADKLIEPLERLGYPFNKEEHKLIGTPERHLFRKGAPTQFHLSLAYTDHGSFLERQILFRDYLREHDTDRDAYGMLKKELLKKDPTGKNEYIGGKTDFVMGILKKAGFQNKWFDLSKY